MISIPRISTVVLVVASLVPVSCASSDTDTVEQLIDAHDRAWLDNDPEGVGALFVDEGVFVDLTGGETVGRAAIVRYAEGHVKLIPESRRTGPVEAQGDGTFVYPGHLVVDWASRSGTYTGVVALTVENGLIARYDISRLTRTEDP